MKDQEKEIAYYIKDFFDREDIPCEVTEIEEGRFNVTAVLKGSGGGRSLMLTGHMDTVPAYDMKNAFDGTIADGRVMGRGACDMKGPLVSMMAAMAYPLEAICILPEWQMKKNRERVRRISSKTDLMPTALS